MSLYDFVALFQAKNTPAVGVAGAGAACSGCGGTLSAAGLAKGSRPVGLGWPCSSHMGLALLLPRQPGTEVTSSVLPPRGDLAPLSRAVPDATAQPAVHKNTVHGESVRSDLSELCSSPALGPLLILEGHTGSSGCSLGAAVRTHQILWVLLGVYLAHLGTSLGVRCCSRAHFLSEGQRGLRSSAHPCGRGAAACAKEMCPKPVRTAGRGDLGPRDLTCPYVSELLGTGVWDT